MIVGWLESCTTPYFDRLYKVLTLAFDTNGTTVRTTATGTATCCL